MQSVPSRLAGPTLLRRSFTRRIVLTVAACTALAVAGREGQAVPVTHDVAKDYSISANPNGPWSYGYEMTGGTSFIPYTATDMTYWLAWVGDLAGDRTPVIVKNDRSSSHLGVAPGQVALHPGPSGQPSIARWTAPNGIVGTTVIDGRFFPGDGGAMLIGIIVNNDWTAPLFSAVDAGDFHVVSTLSPGDTIDFAVYGGYSNGMTPLDALITVDSTAVPEIDPAGLGSVAALVAGAVGLAEKRIRSRRDRGGRA